MASIVVRRLSDDTKQRLRQRATRHKRSLEAEVRTILEHAAQEAEAPIDQGERFPDWFIRMTRPGVDLDPAIEEHRCGMRAGTGSAELRSRGKMKRD